MSDSFVYRTYTIRGNRTSVRDRITERLIKNGYVLKNDTGAVRFFRYPKILFSSKRPLTCISRLSLDVMEKNTGSSVKIGVTFTKIRYFTIGIMLLICVVVPVITGIIKYGIPDIPPVSYLGIPLGFMLHYHVRARAFRALKRLVYSVEENV